MDKKYKVTLKCVFCSSTQFEYDENCPPKDGDLIKCENCGKINDYTTIKNLCVNQKIKEIEKEVHNEVKNKIDNMLKKLIKN